MPIDRSQSALLATILAASFFCACGGEDSEAQVVSTVELDAAQLAALGATGSAAGFDVVIFTIDTVRYDRLGCSGHATAVTPAIDALAGTGLRFESAIAPAPITLPSHATIFTGLEPPSHGVRNNGTFVLGEAHRTLAQELKGAGYATAAFIGAYVLDERYGLARGFDLYDDDVNPSGSARTSGHYNERAAGQVTNAALKWFTQSAASATPRFAWLHYFDAHHPYEPRGEFARRFRNSPYDGEIAYVDSEIARVIEHLRQSGRLERTLIVVTSDHGESLGEHAELTHSRLIYDSTLRVPLILSNPTLFPESVVVRDRVVGLVDLFPTVLDLVGVSAQNPVDGRHLLKDMDPQRAIYAESLVPLLNHGWAPLQGLRRLGDKFIAAPKDEYYDVGADPGELYNLIGEGRAGATELKAELTKTLSRWESALGARDLEQRMDPEQAKRLAALGYTRSTPSGAIGVMDPKDMMVLWREMSEARSMSDAGQHSAALAKNDAILRKNPNDAYAWETASLIKSRMGDVNGAEVSLRTMLQLQPTAEGYVRLAQLQLARRAGAEMEASLQLAATLDPSEGGVYMVRGDAFAMAGRFREALASFEHALELDAVKWAGPAREKIAMARAQL